MTKHQVQRGDHEAEAKHAELAPGRHDGRPLSGAEIEHRDAIKDAGAVFLKSVQAAVKGRHLTIAEHKIEEAIMWAVKGLAQ